MTQTDIYIFNILIITFSLYNWAICTFTFFLDYTQMKYAGKYSKWIFNNFLQF